MVIVYINRYIFFGHYIFRFKKLTTLLPPDAVDIARWLLWWGDEVQLASMLAIIVMPLSPVIQLTCVTIPAKTTSAVI